MAKDAKGHGSESRGYSQYPGYRTMTGAQRTNARHDAIWERARAQGHTTFNAEADAAAAKALAAPGNPKSAAAPVHPDAAGRSDRAFGHLSHGEPFRFSSERDHPFSGMAKGPWTKTSARGYTHAETGGKYRVGSTKAKVMKP